jgi:hypothetical protein
VLHRGVCLLALGIPLLIGCGSGGNPNDLTPLGNSQGVTRQIAGEWSGKLHQKGLPPFKVAVKITPSGGGLVDPAAVPLHRKDHPRREQQMQGKRHRVAPADPGLLTE